MDGFKFAQQNYHSRTILYVETDLLSKKLSYSLQPTAVRLEQEVVACNKAARDVGIFEKMTVPDAVARCPGLILVGPEQIIECSAVAEQVTCLLKSFSPLLERIDLDHCYLDITEHPVVVNHDQSNCRRAEEKCDASPSCKCHDRLLAASNVAKEIVYSLQNKFRLPCRVGISTTKILARISSTVSLMGGCYVLFPNQIEEFLSRTDCRRLFPDCPSPKEVRSLREPKKSSYERAVNPSNAVTCGFDVSSVVPCDHWRALVVECEVKEKFRMLLLKLVLQAAENGRTPLVLKVSVRKFDAVRNTTVKDAKSSPVSTTAVGVDGRVTPETEAKLLNLVMTLFHRLVDFSQSFQITLLGLAFVRFQENPAARSVASCLLRKRELSVQTVVSISCDGCIPLTPPMTHRRRMSTASSADVSDCEDVLPCEKKAKLDIVIKKRKFKEEEMDVCSPSKLKVGDLSLNCDDVPAKTSRSFVAARCFN